MISDYNISRRNTSTSLFGAVDKVALGLYITIVLIGVMCITSASYDPEKGSIFSLSHNYMKQLIWVSISCMPPRGKQSRPPVPKACAWWQ